MIFCVFGPIERGNPHWLRHWLKGKVRGILFTCIHMLFGERSYVNKIFEIASELLPVENFYSPNFYQNSTNFPPLYKNGKSWTVEKWEILVIFDET
jgi:hypothetical protein